MKFNAFYRNNHFKLLFQQFPFYFINYYHALFMYCQFFPAVGKEYDDMVESGYQSMMNWKGTMISKVGHRQPNYEALYVLWFLKIFEVLIFEGIVMLRIISMYFISLLKYPFVCLKGISTSLMLNRIQ